MAPLEVFVDRKNINVWEVQGGKTIKEEPNRLSLNPGDSLRVDTRDAMIQVRCSREDVGGQIFVQTKFNRIGIPRVDWGFMNMEEPTPEEIHTKAIALIKKGSSADVMIAGEVLFKVKHKSNK